jgi:hypothetical protein
MYASYMGHILRQKGATLVDAVPRPPREAGMRGSFPIVDLEVDIRWRA